MFAASATVATATGITGVIVEIAPPAASLSDATRSIAAEARATARVEVAVGAATEAFYAARRAVGHITTNAAGADPKLYELRQLTVLAKQFRAVADELDAAASAAAPKLGRAA